MKGERNKRIEEKRGRQWRYEMKEGRDWGKKKASKHLKRGSSIEGKQFNVEGKREGMKERMKEGRKEVNRKMKGKV